MSINCGIGKVYTYRKQEPVNIGNGVFDTSKVYTLEDNNGKVIVDNKLSKIVTKNEYENVYQKIGDKIYKTVKINGITWMAENLDYKWDGLIIGVDSVAFNDEPRAAYLDDEESTWGYNGRKVGLYYNGNSIGQLNSKIDGWRLPTQEEFENLLNSITVENIPHVNELVVPETNWTLEEYSYDYVKTPILNKTGLSLLPAGSMDYGSICDNTYPYIILPAQNNVYYTLTFPNTVENYGTAVSSTELEWMFPITVRLVKDN